MEMQTVIRLIAALGLVLVFFAIATPAMAQDGSGGDEATATEKPALIYLGGAFGAGLVILGAGYGGYRLYGARNKKAIEGDTKKALGSGKSKGTEDDFARRMAELDALEKKLDAQIKDR